MLANRFKSLLPYVVLESQSVFQSDKAISDNILLAFEMLHHISITLVEKKKCLKDAEVAVARGGDVDSFFLQLKSEVNKLLSLEEKNVATTQQSSLDGVRR